jgi:hypothetical protein
MQPPKATYMNLTLYFTFSSLLSGYVKVIIEVYL